MKIIAVFPATPWPFGDTAARWFYVLLKGLLVRGHEVVCLTATPRPFGDTAARWFYVLTKSLLQRGHEVVCLVATEESGPVVAESQKLLANAVGPGRLTFQTFSLYRQVSGQLSPSSAGVKVCSLL